MSGEDFDDTARPGSDFEEPGGPECVLCHDFDPNLESGVCDGCRRKFSGLFKVVGPMMQKMGEQFMEAETKKAAKLTPEEIRYMRGEPVKMRPAWHYRHFWIYHAGAAFRSACFLAALYIVIREAVK